MFQAIASWVLSGILDAILPDPLNHGPLNTAQPYGRNLLSLTSLRDEVKRVQQDITYLAHVVADKTRQFRKLSTIVATLREDARKQLQDLEVTIRSQNVPQRPVEDSIDKDSPRQEARKVVAEILYFSSDVQTLAGRYSMISVESLLC
jgi:hypothetical protein